MLMTHYREPIDWTHQRFTEARDEVVSWHELLKEVSFDDQGMGESVKVYVDALSDDLNTPLAISHLRQAFKARRHRQLGEGMALLGLFDSGLMQRYDLTLTQALGSRREEIDSAVNARLAALNAKDFATADRIRADLLEQGIQLMDARDAAGNRVTTWEVKR
jgi:cysteinyl-tRNA synthetase